MTTIGAKRWKRSAKLRSNTLLMWLSSIVSVKGSASAVRPTHGLCKRQGHRADEVERLDGTPDFSPAPPHCQLLISTPKIPPTQSLPPLLTRPPLPSVPPF